MKTDVLRENKGDPAAASRQHTHQQLPGTPQAGGDTPEHPIAASSHPKDLARGMMEREYRGYTPRGTLWFYLRDHGEDMRKWDGKPTSSLEAQVHELQGKTITKGDSVRKNAAPLSSSQLSRPGRQFDPE